MSHYSFVNELAQVIKKTSEKSSNDAVRFPVIGTLDDGMNLLLDGFGRPIPKDDYHVYEPKFKMYQWPSNSYVEDYRMELLLKPGDRVLCIPIEDGHTLMIMGQVN